MVDAGRWVASRVGRAFTRCTCFTFWSFPPDGAFYTLDLLVPVIP